MLKKTYILQNSRFTGKNKFSNSNGNDKFSKIDSETLVSFKLFVH